VVGVSNQVTLGSGRPKHVTGEGNGENQHCNKKRYGETEKYSGPDERRKAKSHAETMKQAKSRKQP